MKIKYYTKLIVPLCFFGLLFRIMEIIFAIEKDTAYYVRGSVIPVLFNLYCIAVVLFLLSSVFLTATEKKPSTARISRFSAPEQIIGLVSATFFLASPTKNFLFHLFIEKDYTGFVSVIKSFDFYLLIFGVLSCFALVQFVTAPKQTIKTQQWQLLLLAMPVYFILKLFQLFTNVETILNHSYTSFRIVYLAGIILALVNLVKLAVGNCSRKYFTLFSLIAFFFAIVRFSESILYCFPGNPYEIEMDLLDYGTELFAAIFMLTLAIKVSKKYVRPDKEDRISTDIPKEIAD